MPWPFEGSVLLCCCCLFSLCLSSVYLLLLLLFWAAYRVTGVCFRIVLGIITKKNILEHLEELKQHTEPLVTSPAPFTHVTSPPLSRLSLRLRLLGGMHEMWCEKPDSSRLNITPSLLLFLTSRSAVCGLVCCGFPSNGERRPSLTSIFIAASSFGVTM